MTNQQELRERIAEVIDREYGSFTCSMTNTEARALAFEVTDLLLPLLSPPDPGLASLVGEIEAAYGDSGGGLTDNTIEVARNLRSNKAVGLYIKTDEATYQKDADFIRLLFNNWPRLRAALTTGGSGWRPISEAPKDGTHFLAGQWFVDGGKPEFHCAVTWWSHTWGFGGDTRVENPTHWMPLPPEPETGGG